MTAVRSARRDIRDIWDRLLSGRPTAKVHDETDRIVDALLARDEFVHRYAAETLRDEVLATGLLLSERWRTQAAAEMAPKVEAQRAAIVAEVKREIADGAAAWLVAAGGRRTANLLDLTRDGVLILAQRKHADSLDAMRDAEWLRRIGERMADGQMVRDCWSTDELATLRDRISVSFVASLQPGEES